MRNTVFIVILSFFLKLTCFAQLWSEQNSGVSVSLNSVSAINGNAWTCGNNGTVLRTTNGGSNWLNASGNIPNNITLTSIFCENDVLALTAGNSNVQAVTYAYRTTNGGVNWYQVFSQNLGSINAIYMSSTGNFMVGNPVSARWSLWKSTDDGVSWDSAGMFIPAAGYDSGFPNSLFKNGNDIWFGTSTAKVYYSSNNGVNWVSQSILPDTTARAIWFLPGNSGDLSVVFGLCGGTSMVKTTNSGSNWLPITAPGTGNINGITGGLNDQRTWFIRGNTIYTSYSQGTGWYTDYIAPSGTFTAISLVRDIPTRIWAVRSNGGIAKYPGFSTIINNSENEIPDRFLLSQNYPNPFNPTTKIQFQLPASPIPSEGGVNVKLVVYDILGREVSWLIPPLGGGQEGLRPGTYEVEWDGSNYPSGVYFYKLIVDGASAPDGIGTGPFSITKKMVLLK